MATNTEEMKIGQELYLEDRVRCSWKNGEPTWIKGFKRTKPWNIPEKKIQLNKSDIEHFEKTKRVIPKNIIERPRKVMIAAGKGGSGKDITAIILSSIAARCGYKVVLVDGDLSFSDMDIHNNMRDFENPNKFLHIGDVIYQKNIIDADGKIIRPVHIKDTLRHIKRRKTVYEFRAFVDGIYQTIRIREPLEYDEQGNITNLVDAGNFYFAPGPKNFNLGIPIFDSRRRELIKGLKKLTEQEAELDVDFIFEAVGAGLDENAKVRFCNSDIPVYAVNPTPACLSDLDSFIAGIQIAYLYDNAEILIEGNFNSDQKSKIIQNIILETDYCHSISERIDELKKNKELFDELGKKYGPVVENIERLFAGKINDVFGKRFNNKIALIFNKSDIDTGDNYVNDLNKRCSTKHMVTFYNIGSLPEDPDVSLHDEDPRGIYGGCYWDKVDYRSEWAKIRPSMTDIVDAGHFVFKRLLDVMWTKDILQYAPNASILYEHENNILKDVEFALIRDPRLRHKDHRHLRKYLRRYRREVPKARAKHRKLIKHYLPGVKNEEVARATRLGIPPRRIVPDYVK
ncbi:hypothetical protein DRJ17_03930 [Candidatus Woesearchaeota archaeon]|nr:MAG: hypothetical protein DRJ17_03930 [Candidatus Woesearchaeota archaeon]